MADTARETPLLRRALAAVLKRKFDEGLARGGKIELGEALGASGRSASTRVSRLLAGEQFPDRHWDVVAEFVGSTPAGLLREVALEVEREIEKG